MGPSGTGKTTLLRLIGGQLSPDQGEVLLDGKNIAAMSRHELFAARARMGMLFQSGALFTDMSVYENVAFPISGVHNTTSVNPVDSHTFCADSAPLIHSYN
jgi:phospholipid/cholesterol/gamma-HCH transport system ATP-binding protein